MPPMVIDQDSMDVPMFDDMQPDPADLVINFDEIASLADFDYSKLMEDNGLGVDLPPAAPQAVVVQSAIPDNSAVYGNSDLQHLQPPSPEMFPLLAASDASYLQYTSDPSYLEPAPGTLLQPVSPGTMLQPASPGTMLQPASPGTIMQSASVTMLQPVSPGTMLQPVSPGTMLQPASPGTMLQPASPGIFSPAGSSISSEPEYLQPQYVETVSMKPSVPVLSAATFKVEVTPPEESAEMPKKRGRKPKYPKGMAPPRRSRPKKPKAYEQGPYVDEAQEKKRKNAINAKLHRDKQKQIRDSLATQLQKVTAERDGLLKLVEELKRSEASLRLRLSKGM